MQRTELKKIQLARDPVKTNIVRAIRSDGDAIVVAGGKRGSTKSGSLISLFDDLDRDIHGRPRFTLPYQLFPKEFRLREGERMPRVVWKPKDFLSLITMSHKLPSMSGIIWDETGVEGDSREFLTLKNRLIKKVLETIRSRNLLIGLTAPTIKSFDVSFRRVMTHYTEMSGAVQLPQEKKRNHGKTKVYLLDISGFTGKIYKKYIIYRDPEEGRLRSLDQYYFIRRPNPAIEAPYKRLKDYVQTVWYKNYDEVLSEFKDIIHEKSQEEKNKVDLKSLAKEFTKNPEKFYDFEKKKIVRGALMGEFNISSLKAKELSDYLKFLIKNGEINVNG